MSNSFPPPTASRYLHFLVDLNVAYVEHGVLRVLGLIILGDQGVVRGGFVAEQRLNLSVRTLPVLVIGSL